MQCAVELSCCKMYGVSSYKEMGHVSPLEIAHVHFGNFNLHYHSPVGSGGQYSTPVHHAFST